MFELLNSRGDNYNAMNTAKYGVGADSGFRPATEQEQAKAYVREQRPALMELTFGCRVKYGTSYTTVWQVLLAENSKEQNHYNTVDVRGASNYLRDIQSSEIIGHPIQLHDWLAVLVNHCEQINYIQLNGTNYITFMANRHPYKTLLFNLTTGQPNSPQDYANFNQIVNN